MDPLTPKTAIDRGPNERLIHLDDNDPESLSEGAGDTAGNDLDSNVGGAAASRGLDSGGAVGVRRGRSVGRMGSEFDDAEHGETSSDLPEQAARVIHAAREGDSQMIDDIDDDEEVSEEEPR